MKEGHSLGVERGSPLRVADYGCLKKNYTQGVRQASRSRKRLFTTKNLFLEAPLFGSGANGGYAIVHRPWASETARWSQVMERLTLDARSFCACSVASITASQGDSTASLAMGSSGSHC